MTEPQKEAVYELLCDWVLSAAAVAILSVIEDRETGHGQNREEDLDRRAYVYVRQSSLAQVQHHQESTQRQYRLQERAVALGWAAVQVEVIDEDQGQSGASSENRMGFQRLVSEVALGKGGAILGLEVSRLAGIVRGLVPPPGGGRPGRDPDRR